MARKKVIVRYIPNGPTRKETGKKRTVGLVKKAAELSTLCDIDVVLSVFPEGESSSSPAVVYPSSRPETMRIVDRFKSMPERDRRRNTMDGEGYVRERMRKVQDQLRKAERDNRRRETLLLLHGAIAGGLRPRNLEGLAVEQLASVGWTAENLMKKIRDSIETCRSGGQHAGSSEMPDDQGLPHAAAVADVEAAAPQLQNGWAVNVGWDLNALTCSASRGGSRSYGDGLQLGNVEAGLAWASTYFPPV